MQNSDHEQWFSQEEIARNFVNHPIVEVKVLARAALELANFTRGAPADCIQQLAILHGQLAKAYEALDPRPTLKSPRGKDSNINPRQQNATEQTGPQIIRAAELRNRSATYASVPILPALKEQTRLFLQDIEQRLTVLSALVTQAQQFTELSTKYKAAHDGMERIGQRNGDASRTKIDRMNANYFHDQSVYYREASLTQMQVVRDTAQLMTTSPITANPELSDAERKVFEQLKDVNNEMVNDMNRINSISEEQIDIKYGELMPRSDDLKTLQQNDTENHQMRQADRMEKLPRVVQSLAKKVKSKPPEASNETKSAMQDIKGHHTRLEELDTQRTMLEAQITNSRHQQAASVIKVCATDRAISNPELSILRVDRALAVDNLQKTLNEASKLDNYNATVENTINTIERLQVGDTLLIREVKSKKTEEVTIADQMDMLNKFLEKVDAALTNSKLPEAYDANATQGRRETLGLTDTMHAVRQRSRSVAESGPAKLDLQSKKGESAVTEAQRERAKSISGFNNSRSNPANQSPAEPESNVQNDNNSPKLR